MATLQLSLSLWHPSASLTAPTQRTRSAEVRSIPPPQESSPCNEFSHFMAFDSVMAVNALTSSTASRDLGFGSCIHSKILKSGLGNNVFVNNSLLDMYMKCGCIENAEKLFELMPERTVVTWTSMMSGYCHNELAGEAISIFLRMIENVYPNEFTLAAVLQACGQKGDNKLAHVIHGHVVKSGFSSDNFLKNSLVGTYSKSGLLPDAVKFLDSFGSGDVVSWTSVISGYIIHGMMEEALGLFFRMQQEGVIPNEVTIISILRACSFINDCRMFQWVHGLVTKVGWCNSELVLNSLVEMYVVNGYFNEGMRVFCEFYFEGNGMCLCPETMATLLQGCGHLPNVRLGEQFHGYLIKHRFYPCIIVENSLIDMYTQNEQCDLALRVFASMRDRDIVSWNSMATCLVKNSRFIEALTLLRDIHRKGRGDATCPDFITMLTSIQACSNLASLQVGEVIHGYLTKTGLLCDIFIQNALINMYGRTGRLDLAEMVFEEMPEKEIGSWNSLIAAYGLNGKAACAIKAFTGLLRSGIYQLNAITFVNILSACSHAGMVREGSEIFESMAREYGVEPTMEHLVCMVDLLGRSGRLEEAEAFIRNMPVTPGPAAWGALLGACGFFHNVEIAERAAHELSILEPEGNVWRVTLSNVYASTGRWKDAASVRAEMKGSERMRKEGGWSSVEVGRNMFKFMVNDSRHPESKLIYKVLSAMKKHIRDDRQQSSVCLASYRVKSGQ